MIACLVKLLHAAGVRGKLWWGGHAYAQAGHVVERKARLQATAVQDIKARLQETYAGTKAACACTDGRMRELAADVGRHRVQPRAHLLFSSYPLAQPLCSAGECFRACAKAGRLQMGV